MHYYKLILKCVVILLQSDWLYALSWKKISSMLCCGPIVLLTPVLDFLTWQIYYSELLPLFFVYKLPFPMFCLKMSFLPDSSHKYFYVAHRKLVDWTFDDVC